MAIDPYTYIDRESALAYGARMTKLNEEAIEIIKKIEAEIKNLGEHWEGKAAAGYNTVNANLIKDAKKYHEEMKDVERIIKKVVTTIENQ